MCMIGDSYLGSWPLDWCNNEQHNTIYTSDIGISTVVKNMARIPQIQNHQMNGTTNRETPRHVPHDYFNCLEQ